MYGKRVVFILIDSGSTHNFIDVQVAEKIRCIKKVRLTKVVVADGKKLGVSGTIDKFKWQFQTTTFKADFMLIPSGSCDMMLGYQWLETLGPITWDFRHLEMKFVYENQKVHGMKHGSESEVKANKINRLQADQTQISMICVQELLEETNLSLCSLEAKVKETETKPELDQLLMAFEDTSFQGQK